MFKVGDRVCYSNEDYDQDEVGIVEEIIYKIEDLGDEPECCYAVHWQIADFRVTIHDSMIKPANETFYYGETEH